MMGIQGDTKPSPSKTSSLGYLLTSERLSAVPKRNLHDYLSIYIRDQGKFIKDYVQDHNNEGCRLLENTSDGPKDTHPAVSSSAEASRELVFGTPILKARVVTSSEPNKKGFNDHNRDATNKAEKTRCIDSKAANNNGREDALHSLNKKRPASPAHDDNSSTVKHQRQESKTSKQGLAPTATQKNNHDDEHVKRLEERRQRKRARKDTMLPATRNNDPNNNPSSKTNCNKTQKNQSKSTQVGFALMHGFSATNVGKNRLTINPLSRDFGVFKKGRASTKTGVGGKKQAIGADPYHYFSEAKFLNSISPKVRKPPSVHSSTSSTISSHSGTKSPQKSGGVSHKKAYEQETAISSIHTNENQSGRRYNPEDSIIWDIEKDSDAMSKTDSNDRQGTILIKYSCGLVDPAKQSASKKTVSIFSNHTLEFSNEIIGGSSPPLCAAAKSSSLGPSESASQLCSNQRTTSDQSRYFRCAEPTAASDHRVPAIIDSATSIALELSAPLYANGFDRLVPMSEQGITENLDTCNSRDMVEEHNFQEKFLDNCQAAVRHPDTPSGSLISQTYLSWSLYGIGIDPTGLDFAQCCDAVEEQMEDSPVLQSCPLAVYDLQDFQIQDTVLQDNSDNNFFFPPTVDCPWNSGLYCSNGNPGIASESFDSSGYFLDFSGHGSDHDSIVDKGHHRLRPNSGDMILANFEEGPCSTFSENIEHLDEFANAHRSSSPAPDEEYSQIDSFRQGRALLYGQNLSLGKFTKPTQLSSVEAEVAGNLKLDHWLPQRL